MFFGTRHASPGDRVPSLHRSARDGNGIVGAAGGVRADSLTPSFRSLRDNNSMNAPAPLPAHDVSRNDPDSTPARGRAGKWLRLAAGLLLLAVVVALAGPQRILAVLRGANPGWLALGLVANVAANIVSGLRWGQLSRWLGLRVPPAWAVVTYFHGVAVNALMPGAVVGGDMLRAWSLQRLGYPVLESAFSVLLDRSSGLWMLFVIGFLTIAWGADSAIMAALVGRWSVLDGWSLASAAMTIAFVALLLPLLLLLVLPLRLPRHESPRLLRLRNALRRGHAGRQYLAQVALSTTVQLLSIASLVCAARALHVELPFWVIAACAVPIFVMATLPVSFGGWGTREAASAVVLGAFGVAAPMAVAISMIYGVYALLQAAGGLLPVPEAGASSASS